MATAKIISAQISASCHSPLMGALCGNRTGIENDLAPVVFTLRLLVAGSRTFIAKWTEEAKASILVLTTPLRKLRHE